MCGVCVCNLCVIDDKYMQDFYQLYLKGNEHLEDLGTDGRIIWKLILKK